ncbi:MAG: ribosome-associated translation inhibitor RaiA [Thermoanaerobaculales bacterium]|nr:ribosome-associated translation inhibitor RaiA [Thermoanaerobaculales bacterium]
MMKIDYIARKVDLTEQSRQLAEKKLAKITKYFNDILDVRLEVELERHLHVVDLSIKGKDFDVQATAQNKDLTTAIQDAVDKIEIQARRAKARLKDHKTRAGSEAKIDTGWAVDVIERDSMKSGQPRIVERSSIPIKPMAIEEAVLQLDDSPYDFLVFRNASTDKVNVLYRRDDKNLGLITPEL